MELVVLQSPSDRPVYLLGESFGGVLALAVAEECPDLVDRVVLVNPATSFTRSLWPALGPLLPRVPKVANQTLINCTTHFSWGCPFVIDTGCSWLVDNLFC
jgi:pimeloyl-ACP methyl ester carboxylesterase